MTTCPSTAQRQHTTAVEAARARRRLLDPQVRLAPTERADTAVKATAVDASNRNRAVINQAIRQADKLIAALRYLEHLDEYGELHAGLRCVTQATDSVTDAVEHLEQRLLDLIYKAPIHTVLAAHTITSGKVAGDA